MLFVPTELRPSPIHGIGVFLLGSVKKGDLICRFDSRIDRVISKSELESLPETARRFVEIHAPWNRAANLWMLYGDNARYYNHSANPTLKSLGDAFSDDVAARDLVAGDELTGDYNYCYDNKDLLAHMGLR